MGDNNIMVEQDVELKASGSAPEVTGYINYTSGKGYSNLNVTGGSGIYTYDWSTGATTLHVWEVSSGDFR